MRNLRVIVLAIICQTNFTEANAFFEICNRLGKSDNFAIGYFENGAWWADGWYHIKNNECKRLIGRNINGEYIYYITSTTKPKPNQKYSNFCINAKHDFKIKDSKDCSGENQQSVPMTETYTEPRYHSHRVQVEKYD